MSDKGKEDKPVRLLVAVYDGEDKAAAIMKQLGDAESIGVEHLAIVSRDEKNKLHVKEPDDMGGGKGAAIGGAIGAALGILTGPGVVATTALGAFAGGLYAKFLDTGISNANLKDLARAMEPGMSAVVAVVDLDSRDAAKEVMEASGAVVMAQTMNADSVHQLIVEAKKVTEAEVPEAEGEDKAEV